MTILLWLQKDLMNPYKKLGFLGQFGPKKVLKLRRVKIVLLVPIIMIFQLIFKTPWMYQLIKNLS